MGKPKQKKTKVVLSLAEFNQDAKAGVEPELAALPSAPKAPEEWDEAGGRPVYNSRGFRERKVATGAYDHNDGGVDDEEFMQRDWARTGPLDDPAAPGGHGGPGVGGGDRSWEGMRRGPLDTGGALEGEDDGDRDWSGIRRGPIDEQHHGTDGGDGGAERNWDSVRRQAVDAAGPFDADREVNFGSARRGPLDLEPPADQRGDVDFSMRRGPIEAEFEAGAREVDFATRRGPFEETGELGVERDFSAVRLGNITVDAVDTTSTAVERDFGNARKTATVVEADIPHDKALAPERNFGDVRRGAKHAGQDERPVPHEDVDWNVRKGPVDAVAPPLVVEEGRVRDFKQLRQKNPFRTHPDSTHSRGPKDASNESAGGDTVSDVHADDTECQDARATGPQRGHFVKDEEHHVEELSAKEIDWGRARRTTPLPAAGRGQHRGGMAHRGHTREGGHSHRLVHGDTRAIHRAQSPSDNGAVTSREAMAEKRVDLKDTGDHPASNGTSADDSNWTTVRGSANAQRRTSRGGHFRGQSGPNRRGGGGSSGGSGLRERGHARLVPAEQRTSPDVRGTGPGSPLQPQRPGAPIAPTAVSAGMNGSTE